MRLNESLVCLSCHSGSLAPLGLCPTDAIGKRFPDLLDPAQASAIVETLEGVLEEWVDAVIVASFDPAGDPRWLELKVSRLAVAGDEEAVLDLEIRDVTARVDEENRLRAKPASAQAGAAPVSEASDARFRALADNLRDAVCEIGADGTILYASPSYAELFGESPDSYTGSDPLRPVHPDDRSRVSQIFRPGARSRSRGALGYRARNAMGVSLHLEATAREFEGPDGNPRIVVSIRDVTERENVRRDLERHIELETQVSELSRFFIDVEVDEIHRGIENRLARVAELAGAQHCWLYSFATTKKGNFEFFDWWDEKDPVRLPGPSSQSIATFPYSTRLIQTGRVYQVTDIEALPEEAANERNDMRKRGVRSILGIPIMSRGQFVGFIGFESFDREINWPDETIMLLRMVGEIFYSALHRKCAVEELRKSQSELLQSQKMEAVGTLAGGIAHDFNNHLAVMLSNARFVRQEVNADAEVLAAIDDFERSADHCAQLTRSLLAFSRRSAVVIVPVAVADLVESVAELVRPLLPSWIRFETSLLPDLGSFAVDRVQIQQVLVNLLVNARDAMPEGGLIRLQACRRMISAAEARADGLDADREYVVLGVEDRGHGMDAETQSRVFEPFFTTKDVAHGTGLGLAMAYGIVQQSQGAISVESRLGEGSTFRVYLPSVLRGV